MPNIYGLFISVIIHKIPYFHVYQICWKCIYTCIYTDMIVSQWRHNRKYFTYECTHSFMSVNSRLKEDGSFWIGRQAGHPVVQITRHDGSLRYNKGRSENRIGNKRTLHPMLCELRGSQRNSSVDWLFYFTFTPFFIYLQHYYTIGVFA